MPEAQPQGHHGKEKNLLPHHQSHPVRQNQDTMTAETAPVENVTGNNDPKRILKKSSSVHFDDDKEDSGDVPPCSDSLTSNDDSDAVASEAPEKPASTRSLFSFASNVSSQSMTYGSQHALPRLPIPALSATLHKLSTVVMKALLTEEEQEQMEHDIDKFILGPGPVLQDALLEYEHEKVKSGEIGSYVEEFWNESYLAPDASVVLNLNPFFVLEEGPDPKIAKDQLRRAASLCFASIKVASVLKTETLEPDLFKGQPLCMDQFKVLFGASRQPSKSGSDDVHVYGDSTHVVVLCNNQFYYFPVLWPHNGTVAVDEGDILDILQAIEKHAMETDPDVASKEALGVFTSLPRSEWASARDELVKSSDANRRALQVIDSALFVLVLDNHVSETVHGAAANMLHGTNQLGAGDTVQIGTCLNRWYDKLQIIVCKDGTAGINFEHSSIDGHTALRFVSDVFAETVISFAESIVDVIHGRGRIQHVVEAEVERAVMAANDPSLPKLDIFPKKLIFDLDESLTERIYFAETALCDETESSDTWVLEFKEYGKLQICANKLSPDSFVQMSILLAYYKLYGKVVCMYEPVLTKSFYHGRTEAMRSTTVQAKALCQVWCDKKSTDEEKLNALRIATVEHSRLVKESASGHGVDRHLFALKCIAKRKGMETPAFFESHTWKTLNHTILSTSNCGNPALRLFGFGPVVQDGLGIGYVIKNNGISFSVSSKHRQTRRYIRSLRATLDDIKGVLLNTSTIQVQNRRRTLVDMKNDKTISRQTSMVPEYPDVWGERSAPPTETSPPPSEENPKSLTRKHSKPFAQVVERHESLDILLSLGPDSQMEVDLDRTEHSAGGSFWEGLV